MLAPKMFEALSESDGERRHEGMNEWMVGGEREGGRQRLLAHVTNLLC